MKQKSWMSTGPDFPQLLLMGASGTVLQACAAKQHVIVSEAHYILSPSLFVGLPLLSDPSICSDFNFFTPRCRFLHSGKCLHSFIQKHKEDKTQTNYREGHSNTWQENGRDARLPAPFLAQRDLNNKNCRPVNKQDNYGLRSSCRWSGTAEQKETRYYHSKLSAKELGNINVS